MKEIKLYNSELVTLIDDADFKKYGDISWRVQPSVYTNYCRKWMGGRLVYLHRLILGLVDPKIHVDHINGDGLDNRRINLRTVTSSQNHMNRRKQLLRSGKPPSSKHKGVHLFKRDGTWMAYASINGVRYFLGYHKKEVDAALAYNKFAKEHYGEFAKLNEIPEGDNN